MILHPNYIRATMIIDKMYGGNKFDNIYLDKCAQNNLLAEERIQELLYQWGIKPSVLETVFFDIGLLFTSNKQSMRNNLLAGPFDHQSILESVQEFGQYMNALCFLIVSYSNNLR